MNAPGDKGNRRRLAGMVENWPWLRKSVLLLITGLVALIANTVASGILFVVGVNVHASFSVLSRVLAFLASVPMLWAARPRGQRHLMILSAGTFAAAMTSLLLISLLTYGRTPEATNFLTWKGLVILPFGAALCAWGLVYLLARREEIWTLNRNKD